MTHLPNRRLTVLLGAEERSALDAEVRKRLIPLSTIVRACISYGLAHIDDALAAAAED